jgi:beta-lactamase regulating signal transducer with metallopeptidase domain
MAEALIDHLWQSTLFALAAGLLALTFRNNGAHVRFAIWLAASVKFLIPFAAFVWIGSLLRWETAPAFPPTSAVSIVVDQIAQPAAMVTTNLAATPLVKGAMSADWNGWTIVLAIWLLGSLILIGRRLFEWLYLLAIIKASTPLELDTPIPVRETRSTLEPGIFGIFSPTLLLPAGIATHLTPDQLETILAHELCHWRRRDNLTAAIHMLVEALFWFHPFVWWLGSRLVVERERACDEEVIRAGSDREVYAAGILEVCKRYVEPPFCSAGVSGGTLRKRIEEIMTTPVLAKLPLAKKCLLSVAALAVVAGPLAAGVGSQPAAPAASTSGEMRRYKSSEWKFELDVPARWTVMPPVPTNSPSEIIRFVSRENGNHGLIVFRGPYDPQQSPKAFFDQMQQALAKIGFSNFVSGETTIGSRRVLTLDFERATPEGGLLSCRHYVIIDGTLVYTLGFGTDKREIMFDLYDRMAKSFVFEHV